MTLYLAVIFYVSVPILYRRARQNISNWSRITNLNQIEYGSHSYMQSTAGNTATRWHCSLEFMSLYLFSWRLFFLFLPLISIIVLTFLLIVAVILVMSVTVV